MDASRNHIPPVLKVDRNEVWKMLHKNIRQQLMNDFNQYLGIENSDGSGDRFGAWVLTIAFTTVMLIGIPANIITGIVYIFKSENKKMSPTHYFLVNMSIVDMLRLSIGNRQHTVADGRLLK